MWKIACESWNRQVRTFSGKGQSEWSSVHTGLSRTTESSVAMCCQLLYLPAHLNFSGNILSSSSQLHRAFTIFCLVQLQHALYCFTQFKKCCSASSLCKYNQFQPIMLYDFTHGIVFSAPSKPKSSGCPSPFCIPTYPIKGPSWYMIYCISCIWDSQTEVASFVHIWLKTPELQSIRSTFQSCECCNYLRVGQNSTCQWRKF